MTRDTPHDLASALSLVFVFVGTNSVPHYVLLAVEQASARHTADTWLVVSQQASHDVALKTWAEVHGVRMTSAEGQGMTAHHASFSRVSPLDREARGGLWHLAAERFMILEDFMITNQVHDLVSAECDCLIYTDLNAMAPHLRMEYPHALAAGPVTSNHMTGCVLYVAKREALTNFNRFMLECLQEDQVYLSADIILNAHVNEMVLLAAFFRVHGHRATETVAFLATVPPGHIPPPSPDDLNEQTRPRVLLADVLQALPAACSPCCMPHTAVAQERPDEDGQEKRKGCVPCPTVDECRAWRASEEARHGAAQSPFARQVHHIFDAAAVGIFVGGPRRDSPDPEVLLLVPCPWWWLSLFAVLLAVSLCTVLLHVSPCTVLSLQYFAFLCHVCDRELRQVL